MKTETFCHEDARREAVRAKPQLNGLDYVEVDNDQVTLTVYFLGKAPPELKKGCTEHFRIDGGRRIRNIEVVGVDVVREQDPELDDYVTVRVDTPGDFSTYTLKLVGLENIDPFYDHLDFSFKVNCPSDLDCAQDKTCPPEHFPEPEINYLAKDYAGFRQLILDRLALIIPDWKERHVPDLGITLVELLAYVGDHLSYYQDSVATEAYLDTARQRISVRRHARLVDYRMHEGCNSRAWVCVQAAGSVKLNPPDILFVTSLQEVLQTSKAVLSRDELRSLPSDSFLAYEPLVADPSEPIEICEEHNAISFYTWGQRECCLPKGATSATLQYGWAEAEPSSAEQEARKKTKSSQSGRPSEKNRKPALKLKPGDVLIFEEVRGPKTGDPADADPAHRHAVRLTLTRPEIDPLDNTPVLEIGWSLDDALPFPLCLSGISDGEHGCVYHNDISIARGNVILADHGERIPAAEDLGTVPTARTKAECDCEGHPGETALIAGRYTPMLAKSQLSFSQPVNFTGPASKVMQQDPREALPQVTLTSRQKAGSNFIELNWRAKSDLLESTEDDADFVVEIDNDGRAHLRFGDGDCGRRTEAGMMFSALYRVGNGKAANVGPEAIVHLVYRNEKPDGIDGIRNPLPAQGGMDPETINEVKLFAPSAFRKQLQRAITADDYARIAERNPKVQRAGAVLCWNGSWYEAHVAIDPKGSEQAGDELLREIEGNLYPFRRIGHNLRVAPAHYVWLDVSMNICVKPEYLRGHVKAALLERFSNRTLPGGKLGFFHPDNLTFGEGMFLSRLVAAALEVEGVEIAMVTRLQRQFEMANHELENGVLSLGPLEIARCDNEPRFPKHGTFELTVGGGR
jgi:hypothetical protein